MAFPNLQQTVELLGYRAKDKITGLTGVVTSVSLDLYGCVQAALHPGLDKDGKIADQHWYDVARLEGDKADRVMQPPAFGNVAPAAYEHGPAEKSRPRAV